MLMYVQDYDERSHGPTGGGTNWAFVGGGNCAGCFQRFEANAGNLAATGRPMWAPLSPYIKNTGVWYCPSTGSWRSYAWSRGGENRIAAQFQHPAQTVMFADGGYRGTGNGDIAWIPHNYQDANTDRDCCTNMSNVGTGNHKHWIGTAHMDGANIAFWDGHVKWYPVAAIPAGRRGNGIKFVAEDPISP